MVAHGDVRSLALVRPAMAGRSSPDVGLFKDLTHVSCQQTSSTGCCACSWLTSAVSAGDAASWRRVGSSAHGSHHALSSSQNTRRDPLIAYMSQKTVSVGQASSRTPSALDKALAVCALQRESQTDGGAPTSAPWATQHDTRILERLLPPLLWHAACYITMAERAMVG